MLTEDDMVSTLLSKILEEHIVYTADGNPEYPVKSVRALLRLLRKHNAVDNFAEALLSESSMTQCCVVNNEKLPSGRANVSVLQMFRFPWIRFDTQIRSVPSCRQGFRRKQVQVCLNPYHYKVVEVPIPILPPILINKSLHRGEVPMDSEQASNWALMRLSKMHDDDEDSGAGPESTEAPEDDSWIKRVPNMSVQGDEIRQLFERLYERQLEPGQEFIPFSPPTESKEVEYSSGLSSPASVRAPSVHFDIDAMMVDADEKKPEITKIVKQEYNLGIGALAKIDDNFTYVEYEELQNWMTLAYFEKETPVTPPIEVSWPTVLVDGFTSSVPAPNKISLGSYNNVNRIGLCSQIRGCIGRGIRLFYMGGEVYLESRCEAPIFLQSISANMNHNWHINTVIKVPSKATIKVFDNIEFASALANAADRSYQDVMALSNTCSIRVSFVKGWGASYKRSSILQTPCWLQVQFNSPVKWIDKCLESMGAPQHVNSSRT